MAKIEIPKISDFRSLGLCDGFAKVMLHLNSKTNTINRPDVIVDVKYLKIPSQAAAQVGGYCVVKRLIP